MKCHSCDAELNDGMRFCTACGAKIEEETVSVPDTEQQQTSVSAAAATPDIEPQASVATETVDRTEIKIKCHNCGAELNGGMRFCTACGAKIDGETAFAPDIKPQASVPAASPTPYYAQPQTNAADLYTQTGAKKKSSAPKKIIAVALAVIIVLGTAGFFAYKNIDFSEDIPYQSENAEKYGYDHTDLKNMLAFISVQSKQSSADITAKSTAAIKALGNTFDTYYSNKSKVTEFYAAALKSSDELFEVLNAVTADYYRCVAQEHQTEYISAMTDIYNAYNAAMGEFWNAWNSGFADIFSACFDNLLKTRPDKIPYKTYSDAFSAAYSEYTDSYGKMKEKHSDNNGKLYTTYSDIYTAFNNGAKEIIQYSLDKLPGASAQDTKSSKKFKFKLN